MAEGKCEKETPTGDEKVKKPRYKRRRRPLVLQKIRSQITEFEDDLKEINDELKRLFDLIKEKKVQDEEVVTGLAAMAKRGREDTEKLLEYIAGDSWIDPRSTLEELWEERDDRIKYDTVLDTEVMQLSLLEDVYLDNEERHYAPTTGRDETTSSNGEKGKEKILEITSLRNKIKNLVKTAEKELESVEQELEDVKEKEAEASKEAIKAQKELKTRNDEIKKFENKLNSEWSDIIDESLSEQESDIDHSSESFSALDKDKQEDEALVKEIKKLENKHNEILKGKDDQIDDLKRQVTSCEKGWMEYNDDYERLEELYKKERDRSERYKNLYESEQKMRDQIENKYNNEVDDYNDLKRRYDSLKDNQDKLRKDKTTNEAKASEYKEQVEEIKEYIRKTSVRRNIPVTTSNLRGIFENIDRIENLSNDEEYQYLIDLLDRITNQLKDAERELANAKEHARIEKAMKISAMKKGCKLTGLREGIPAWAKKGGDLKVLFNRIVASYEIRNNLVKALVAEIKAKQIKVSVNVDEILVNTKEMAIKLAQERNCYDEATGKGTRADLVVTTYVPKYAKLATELENYQQTSIIPNKVNRVKYEPPKRKTVAQEWPNDYEEFKDEKSNVQPRKFFNKL